MKKVHTGVWLALLKTLDNHWKTIDYKYNGLTTTEKKAMPKSEFEYLVSEIKALKEEEKNGVVYK